MAETLRSLLEKRIEERLSYPILVLERVRSAVEEAESFTTEYFELVKQAGRLSQMLRSLVRFATSLRPLYERPIRRIISEVSANVRKCCHRQNIIRRIVEIVTAADFRKVFNLVEASIGDMKWGE